jgi:hypothetical protein
MLQGMTFEPVSNTICGILYQLADGNSLILTLVVLCRDLGPLLKTK